MAQTAFFKAILKGLFLFHVTKHLFGCNCVGLYTCRDDGLAVLDNTFGPKTDRTRKQLIKLFQDYGIKISVELNIRPNFWTLF